MGTSKEDVLTLARRMGALLFPKKGLRITLALTNTKNPFYIDPHMNPFESPPSAPPEKEISIPQLTEKDLPPSDYPIEELMVEMQITHAKVLRAFEHGPIERLVHVEASLAHHLQVLSEEQETLRAKIEKEPELLEPKIKLIENVETMRQALEYHGAVLAALNRRKGELSEERAA